MKNKKLLVGFLSIFVSFCFVIVFAGCASANETFIIKEINLEMVKCPAGSFMMGSPEDEYDHSKGETLHSVNITKPFYIGKYEVTQSQFMALMKKEPSNFVGANKPVEQVDWNDAKAFCDNLNQKYSNLLPSGYKFDLPTEEQWEYACRAGTTTALNNGKEITTAKSLCPNLNEVAWYEMNSNNTTHPVGQKKPNAWGIYDMHGNVTEWCKDTRQDSVSGRIFACIRGGNFSKPALFCRSARNNTESTGIIWYYYGFRVALIPVDNSNVEETSKNNNEEQEYEYSEDHEEVDD